jgi:hypothetical protein
MCGQTVGLEGGIFDTPYSEESARISSTGVGYVNQRLNSAEPTAARLFVNFFI